MTQRIVLNQPQTNSQAPAAFATVPSPLSTGVAVVSLTKPGGQIATTWPLKCVVAASPVVTIPAPVYFGQLSPLEELASYLAIGRAYHPLCRNAFVETVTTGHYYAYERDTSWHTCAVAAAYAGAFGRKSIERADFSYSMAIWRLNKQVGYNLDQLQIVGPTGRQSTVYDEMILLTDANLWTRAGLVEWLPTAEIVGGVRQ